MYDYDTNAILVEPLKTRQAKEITSAFQKCYGKLHNNLTTPKLYILDNKCSSDLKLSIINCNAKYELVPPRQHRRNVAEKAIQTFKNHLRSGTISTTGHKDTSSLKPPRSRKLAISQDRRLVHRSRITSL